MQIVENNFTDYRQRKNKTKSEKKTRIEKNEKKKRNYKEQHAYNYECVDIYFWREILKIYKHKNTAELTIIELIGKQKRNKKRKELVKTNF